MAQERTMDNGSTHVADAGGRKTKAGIVFILVALLTAVLYSFFFGVAIVGDAGFTSDEAVHVAGALGFTAALLLGLVIQVVRPTAAAGFWITTAGIVGMLVSVSIVGDPDNYGGQAGPFDYAYLIFAVPILVLLAFHPARRELLRGARPNAIVIAILAIAAIPLVVYGVDQALVQRNSWPPKSDPHHNAHWHTMAWTSFGILVLGLVTALRIPGWRITASAASGMAILLGLVSIVWPDAASSLGRAWGLGAVMGGVIFLVVALRQADPQTQQPALATPG
jgi:hypothetical protein